MQKKTLAIHDISCVGRCSLTVALPILSAAGVNTAVLPTALLSTHTGDFVGYTYRDLSDEIAPIMSHFDSLNLQFDALYSGFLGSFEQIALIEQLFERFKTKDNLILVDPAMADHGRLYATYTREMALGTKALCAKADLIVPNLTEAAILLDEDYRVDHTQTEIEMMLRRLSAIGPKQVVLTGVSVCEGKLGAAAYDRETDTVTYASAKHIYQNFHGTGDVFASALLGAMLNGKTLTQSAEIATHYVHDAIIQTLQEGTELRYGVAFEKALPNFIAALTDSPNGYLKSTL